MHTSSSLCVHKVCILTNEYNMFSSDYKRIYGVNIEGKSTPNSHRLEKQKMFAV